MSYGTMSLRELVDEAIQRGSLTEEMEHKIFESDLRPSEVVDRGHAQRILAMLDEQKRYRHVESMPETIVHDVIASILIGRMLLLAPVA